MRADDPAMMEWLARGELVAHAAKLAPCLQNEIRVEATPALLDDLPLGASRIGGRPDLPPGTPWPCHRWTQAQVDGWPAYAQRELTQAMAAGLVTLENNDGFICIAMPLAFVAQIDLIEVSLYDRDNLLPEAGQLWFFAAPTTTLPGPEGRPALASSVLFSQETSSLQRREAPPMSDRAILPASLSFSACPEVDEEALERAALPPGLVERLRALARTTAQPWPRHALLHTADRGASGALPPPGWHGLLRLDSCEMPWMNWGDSAWIDFCLPAEALTARRFDEAWALAWVG